MRCNVKLSKLIQDLEVVKVIGQTNVEINDVKIDSNQVNSGNLFICIRGKDFDGHGFIRQVELYGAKAVVTEKELDTSLTQIIVKNTRLAMSVIASAFYGHVDRKMKLIAVLGTNGKTTTSHLIKSILDNAGYKCGVIGTLGSYFCDKHIEPSLTTPDPLVLHKTLFEMYACGIRTVVMEISAHAVYFEKVKGLKFSAAVFTNFSQDHLDFFENMEKYKQAKIKFFKQTDCEYVITNVDDQVGRELTSVVKKAITYGLENPSDVFAIKVNSNGERSQFVINLFDCIYDVKIKLIGKFNVYNALAAATTCALMGVKPKKVVEGLESADCISGRLECVYNKNYHVYVDYAHTPDGLKKSLEALRPLVKNRLICVFGCGGNRDQSKRRLMGNISAKNADFTIITSDNPRFEEPMDIISEVEKGVLLENKEFVSIENREEAIFYALNMAMQGDVILIAGKGSEKYQEVLGIKKLYNDKDTVKEHFRRKK